MKAMAVLETIRVEIWAEIPGEEIILVIVTEVM
jgi:hypothetical protein